MKYLVTGASGFIGTNLVNYLRYVNGMKFTSSVNHSECMENEVVAHYNTGENEENFDEIKKHAHSIEQCNITDILEVHRMIGRVKPDVIIHLAAQSGIKTSVLSSDLSFKVNVQGTFNLIEAANFYNVGTFIFASSCGAVLGQREEILTSEMKHNPSNPYGAFKASCEHICRSYGKTYNMNVGIARFSNVYGKFSGNKSSLISKYIKCALNKEDFVINGNGLQERDFIYVDDLVNKLYNHTVDLHLDNEMADSTFHISSGKGLKVMEIIEFLNESLRNYKIEPPKIVLGSREVHDIDRCVAKPNVPHHDMFDRKLKTNLDETVKWFIERKLRGSKKW